MFGKVSQFEPICFFFFFFLAILLMFICCFVVLVTFRPSSFELAATVLP